MSPTLETMVRAATDELRRQVPGLEEIAPGHITIPRRVDIDVQEVVETVLAELHGGWGSIGEVQ